MPYDPAIPILGIYSNELKAGAQKDIYISIFVTALFTIAKRCKQLKCPSTDKQNVVHRYNGIFFSLKKEGNSATFYYMNEP